MTEPEDPIATEGELTAEEIYEIEEIAGTHVRPPWAPLAVVALVAMIATARIADFYWTELLNDGQPEVLLLLSARVRFLLLVTGTDISFLSYLLIAAFRLAVVYVACHLVGRAFGRNVLVWFGKYLGAKPKQIQDILQLFHKAEWFVVPFFTGSNIVAAITGIIRIPLRRLIPLVTIGIVGRLLLWWWVADIADDEVDAVLDFLNRYQTPALIISIVLTIAVIGINLRRGRDFTLDS